MIITREKSGIYDTNIKMRNNEVEGMNPIDVAKMVINLARLDIMIEEIETIREDRYDMNEIYQILKNNTEGNPMRNGPRWRARVMSMMKEIFGQIMQTSKLPDMYITHQKVIENFIKENKWTEEQEMVIIGWVETTKEYTWARCKMTKRQGQNFKLRMEIFEMQKALSVRGKKDAQIGKKINLLYKNIRERGGSN